MGVYAQPPFGGPDGVLKYLARYTHRIAISNHRLLQATDDHVSFTWKNYRDGHRQRVMTLEISGFVRRFLLHVLPSRFVKIRYYGFLAQSQRATSLPRCRDLLATPAKPSADTRDSSLDTTTATSTEPSRELVLCPNCHRGRLVYHRALPPADTS